MSWNILDTEVTTFSADTYNKIQENIAFLYNALNDAGKEIEEIELDSIVTESDKYIYKTILHLTSAESNIKILNDVEESIYYEKDTVYTERFTKENYLRWVNILNDLYDYIIGGNRKKVVLRLNDGIPTIRKKEIVMRGGYFE